MGKRRERREWIRKGGNKEKEGKTGGQQVA
jgi:hypothetical protein